MADLLTEEHTSRGYDDDGDPIPFSQAAAQPADPLEQHRRDSVNTTYDNQPCGTADTFPVTKLRRRGKLLNDVIHGFFRMNPDAVAIMDTPEFQRLRDLKQLGVSCYVYPCACHSRFEHSLGTYFLAERWVTHFKNGQPELGITNHDIRLVSIAGLCHDLGHGPFSHLFDNEVLPRLRELGRVDKTIWSHEQMSCDMLQHLWEENGLDDRLGVDTRDSLRREDLKAIKELISIDKKDYDADGNYHGKFSGRPRLELGGKMFLYEIVANGRNSVDVDKFDYMTRDARACNVEASFNYTRLMQLSKVIDNRICFKQSEVMSLYNLFHTRANLHHQVYTHAKSKAIEFMVTEALVAADRCFRFNDLIWCPSTFKTLDDTILRRIEWSNEDSLKEARAILGRLRRRDLYKCVGEMTVPEELHRHWSHVSPSDIVSMQPCGSGLTVDDIIVDNREINYSMKKVQFFEKLDSQDASPLEQGKVSCMLPRAFQDKKVRLYVRDASKLQGAAEAFDTFAKSRSCTSPVVNTPNSKRPRFHELEETIARGAQHHAYQRASISP